MRVCLRPYSGEECPAPGQHPRVRLSPTLLTILLGSVLAASPAHPQTDAPPSTPLTAVPLCPASPAPLEPSAPGSQGSASISVDSWIYPAVERLYSLGYGDTVFLTLRPWTRQSTLHVLERMQSGILREADDQAAALLDTLLHELRREVSRETGLSCIVAGLDTMYSRTLLIGGPTLNDSYHLGQTFANDYGRPYQAGFNNVSGASTLAERGRFSLFIRGEWQHAPSGAGYSGPLADQLSGVDWIARSGPNLVQATIPAGPIARVDQFRLVEASLSAHLAGHELSLGKTDAWLGPAQGGALAWSNNAENIYAVHLDRVEPLTIPFLSRLLGPVRYQILYGSLKGHTAPNSPYIHAESFSFHPTTDVEFAFERTVIFGGKAHEPVNLHSFLRGFISISDTSPAEKDSPLDPGARFSDFSFSWRLPYLRRYATFYTDSFSHDDVTPISAPRRAAFRTGLFLARLPHAHSMSVRAEAAVTDPRVSVSNGGHFLYFESIQRQGYTNKGLLLGDAIGREAKGGQLWLTWHLSGNEEITAGYTNKKTAHDFILGGTTQNQGQLLLRKRLTRSLELTSFLQVEQWKAPVLNKDTGVPLYRTGPQRNVAGSFQITFYPAAAVR